MQNSFKQQSYSFLEISGGKMLLFNIFVAQKLEVFDR